MSKTSEYYDVYDRQPIHLSFVVKYDLFLSDEERTKLENAILNVLQNVYKRDVDNIEISTKPFADRLPLHIKADEVQEMDFLADVEGDGITYYDSHGFYDGIYDEESIVTAKHYIDDSKKDQIENAMKEDPFLSNIRDYVDSVNVTELTGWEKI